jgi:regulator of protease activity HflC (stomatin/prohibitin superfamily)
LQDQCGFSSQPATHDPRYFLNKVDNISINVDSCVYYYISQPHLNYFRVDNLEAALMKISGGIIKNTIAIFTFQELLEKKAEITADIEKQVRPVIANWGIAIDNVCLKSASCPI